MNKIQEYVIRLLGGLNEATLNAIFEAAGQKNSFTGIKEQAVKNLQAIQHGAMTVVQTAKNEKTAAAETNSAELAEALKTYTATVKAANSRLELVNTDKDKTIAAETKKAKDAADQLKLIR